MRFMRCLGTFSGAFIVGFKKSESLINPEPIRLISKVVPYLATNR